MTIGLFYNHPPQRETSSPSCHVDEGDIFSRQLNKENQDTSVVGMTALKDAETYAELDS